MITALFHKYRSSIAAKLMLAFIATVCVALLSLIALLWYWERNDFEQRYIPDSLNFAQVVISDIGNPPNFKRAERLSVYFDTDIYISSVEGVWSSNGEGLPNFLKNALYTPFSNKHSQSYSFFYTEQHGLNIRWIGSQHIIYIIEDPGLLKVADLRPILLMFAAVMFVILIFYYILTRRFFSPIQRIEESIRLYTAGDLQQRVKLKSKDEFGQLANQLDLMRDEIQDMLEAKRQLLLAISHELRTPLTRATISIAMLEESSITADVKNDLRDINCLIEGLLEGERLGEAHQKLHVTQTTVNKLLEEVVSFFPSLTIILQALEFDTDIYVDETRVQLLLRNLINNADHYATPVDAEVPPAIYLSATIEHETLILKVKDLGKGIDSVHLKKLTEPFYRINPSKNSNEGGYGLGLYLCRKIVEAHGGQLYISSAIGAGVTVCAHLPVLSLAAKEIYDDRSKK